MGKSAKNRDGGKKGGAKGESLKEKARKRRQLEQLKERAKRGENTTASISLTFGFLNRRFLTMVLLRFMCFMKRFSRSALMSGERFSE